VFIGQGGKGEGRTREREKRGQARFPRWCVAGKGGEFREEIQGRSDTHPQTHTPQLYHNVLREDHIIIVEQNMYSKKVSFPRNLVIWYHDV